MKKPSAHLPIVVAGFCKSGTTGISKCIAHCLGLEWQNEIRACWHIDQYAQYNESRREIHERMNKTGEIQYVSDSLFEKKVIKFPQGVYIPDMIADKAHLIIVVRDPADTICAYLERQHNFESLSFPIQEVFETAQKWNYAYSSLTYVSPSDYMIVRYEDFISNPETMMKSVCLFSGYMQKCALPEWQNEQALPYLNIVRNGHPIRGIGRSALSLSPSQIKEVSRICHATVHNLTNSDTVA